MTAAHLKQRRSLGVTFLSLLGIASVVAGSALVANHPTSAEAATTAPTSKILRTSGSKIIDANGSTHVIKAISWFGMETDLCAPHGLWQIKLKDGLKKIQQAGFNTVRLPYSNDCLHASSVKAVDANPDLAQMTPLQLMDEFVKDANADGLDVILDQHRPNAYSQSPLWYSSDLSEAQWIADWRMLAKRYQSQSNVIGADLHNEPAGNSCWGCGDSSRDWRAAAERGGNAILAVNPHWLIIVEGVATSNNGESTWWGGGLWDAGKNPVKLSVSNKLVYSTHEYPASLYNQSWFQDSNYPNNLPGVWDAHWGYLVKQNIAPVFIGEFGTKLETTSDKQWLNSLVSYIGKNGFSFGYWSFNPDSGDTGGIVKDDWTTLQTDKLAALKPILTATPVTAPTPTPTKPPVTATPTPTPTKTPTPTPVASKVNVKLTIGDHWNTGYIANITVTGTAKSWTVSWKDTKAQSVSSAWGVNCNVSSGTVTCTGSDWATSPQAGQTYNVGLQMNADNGPSNLNPTITVTSK